MKLIKWFLFRYILASFILICLPAVSNTCAYAAEGRAFSAGIIIGEPSGISLKYRNFPVIGIAWSIDNWLQLHCDYWIVNKPLIKEVEWYAGIGGKYIYDKDKANNRNRNDDDEKDRAGVRIPFGVQYFITERFELFGEIVPGILIIPSTDFDIDAGVGIRFHF